MKRIKYLLIFVVSILFVSTNAYSQNGDIQSADDGSVIEEKIEKKSDDPVNYSEEAPVSKEEGESVIKEYPTERVKIKTEQPTEEEIRKEAGYESETVTNSSESEGAETVKKRHKELKHQKENGKSESRGNKDKNNDSPYDHDQGKGNDWKVDPRIDKNDKKDQNYDDERAPDSTKKEKKEKKNKKSKINKKNK